ncbi:MAG: ornithine--oxo-acid transaminase [Acidobacteriia bacterium]|nr:ornithine--oxo-acid transaminase [Terriglobia bacterium]MYG02029.1 ornithine--oxo-acid transaminase [Terriglobia bacterium]MYK09323.1 ornithine--oxo-acid transaminase [Terriglobia bacterium]
MLALEDEWGAHNYHPLPVVVARAEGPWVFDVDGARYLDCLSAYSAVNQGHCHPRILQALRGQAERVTLTSRAYRNDQLPLFCRELAELCGMQMVLPMNTGAEAVETAIKAARKWAYDRKGVEPGRAEILVCENNFHGRTTTIVGFSSDADSRLGFGPFTPGFRLIPFGDADALAEAITPDTCAFLVEPVQCEAGVLIPPAGYMAEAARICRERGVLLVVDEIQTGLGRTGALFACQHEGVQPDMYVLGKALSGGFYPVSAVVSSRDVLGVFSPGTHGSTFGGNPLGCAVAREALRVLADENLVERAAVLGQWFLDQLRTLSHPDIVEIRGIGLIAGIELRVPARPFCERLQMLGMLCKETHDRVIRIAPPLVIEREELTWALDRLREAFAR